VIELEEIWVDGILHGPTTGSHRNRERAFAGAWEKGLRVGVWTEWSLYGALQSRGAYIDGRQAGVWREWHPNGQLKIEGEYVKGRKEGAWEEFDESGDLISRRTYAGDSLRDERFYFRGEEIHKREHIQGGRRSEWTVMKGPEGELKHGLERNWHAGGKLAESGTWLRGQRHGLWRTWDEAGELTSHATWHEGKRVE
jgi:uncharacterized protein